MDIFPLLKKYILYRDYEDPCERTKIEKKITIYFNNSNKPSSKANICHRYLSFSQEK